MLLQGRLKQRQNVLQTANLLVKQQNVRTLHLTLHLLGIGHKVGRDIAAVKLHTLDHLHVSVGALGFLNGDHAVALHLLHRLGNQLTNLLVVIGAHSSDILNLTQVVANLLSLGADSLNNSTHGLVDATLHVHRVRSGGHILQTLVDDALSQNGSGGRAIAGIIVGLAGNLLHELRTDVLELILEFHLARHAHSILRDVRSTVLLVKNHVAAFRTQRHLHSVAQLVNALLQLFTSLNVKFNYLSHCFYRFLFIK